MWAVYIAEADKYDKALVDSWKSDMEGLVIFVSTFISVDILIRCSIGRVILCNFDGFHHRKLQVSQSRLGGPRSAIA